MDQFPNRSARNRDGAESHLTCLNRFEAEPMTDRLEKGEVAFTSPPEPVVVSEDDNFSSQGSSEDFLGEFGCAHGLEFGVELQDDCRIHT
jgi:hypothetical protein